MGIGDQDKSLTPLKVCNNCTEMLFLWTQGNVKSMTFEVTNGVARVHKSLGRFQLLYGEDVRMEPLQDVVALS